MLKLKRFSQSILNTNLSGTGFTKGRKYDMDLNRLGKMDTSQRELTKVGDLGKEMRNLGSNLNMRKEWQRDTD